MAAGNQSLAARRTVYGTPDRRDKKNPIKFYRGTTALDLNTHLLRGLDGEYRRHKPVRRRDVEFRADERSKTGWFSTIFRWKKKKKSRRFRSILSRNATATRTKRVTISYLSYFIHYVSYVIFMYVGT